MKSRLSVALIALAMACPSLAAPPANFDQRVEELRRASETPGMAIAIVENGETVLAKGYGVRKIGTNDPVDPNTIFMTGSTGKAVTVAALATLVDAGKLGWNDKIVDKLPGFQMYDSWVTREMTVRDLTDPSQRPWAWCGRPDVRSAQQSDACPDARGAEAYQAGDELSQRLRL